MTVWPETAESVTVKVALPAASLTVTSLTLRVGAPSLSLILPVPVTPPTESVKVSGLGSLMASLTVGTVTVKDVTPAGTVTLPPERVTRLLKVSALV